MSYPHLTRKLHTHVTPTNQNTCLPYISAFQYCPLALPQYHCSPLSPNLCLMPVSLYYYLLVPNMGVLPTHKKFFAHPTPINQSISLLFLIFPPSYTMLGFHCPNGPVLLYLCYLVTPSSPTIYIYIYTHVFITHSIASALFNHTSFAKSNHL